ncbi:MAG: hypothetical protein JOY62_00845 [Acidobacteriaceae bacterium]|nr:hypothetical protein [Acidobacteriaceae bacterium]MBV9778493.1 hypothetical protein [Acidobacteriaceae bacterium]
MHPGEIYLAHFPFGDVAGMKLRPVLLLTEPVGLIPEILVAYISSVVPAQLLTSDLLIDPQTVDFRSTNVKVRSVLRLHKLATIHCSSLARSLGEFQPPAQSVVSAKLKALLNL